MKYIFITGWQRSGTTLLAKALSAHPKIVVASDPALYFFKEMRNKFYKDILGIEYDEDAPMEDDFLKDIKIKEMFYNNIHKLYFNDKEIKELKKELKEFNNYWPEQHSPLIIPYLNELTEGNVQKVFRQLMDIISKAYGDEKTVVVGIKELYSEQFIKAFIDKFNLEIKNLIIMRDPRAAYASRNTGKYLKRAGGKYSTLFTTRNWRKSVAYHIKYKENKDYLGLKYENLVKNPEKILKDISNFLNLNYSKKMIDTKYFKNGKGEKWKSNSSYKNKSKISTNSINKWKNKLKEDKIRAIEALCEKEMEYLNYEFMYDRDILAIKNLNENKKEIRNWQIKYSYLLNNEEIKKEITRDYLLNSNLSIDSKEILSKFYIFPKIYRVLRGMKK